MKRNAEFWNFMLQHLPTTQHRFAQIGIAVHIASLLVDIRNVEKLSPSPTQNFQLSERPLNPSSRSPACLEIPSRANPNGPDDSPAQNWPSMETKYQT